YELYQNYPNPFNPSTKIGYSIQREGKVNITIYNILGQKVREVINQFVKPGKYEATFNGANLASGVYIYRIKTNDFVKSKKMMLLK
ncbi:MAG: T9SS type A sorting domain-containing protein, partial [Ignavibacteriae bacterium]|nr:T9SS type A sorting domain-containing protein [Ignavibacteriota bacterium]